MEQELKFENTAVRVKNEAPRVINYSGRPVKIIPESADFKRRLLDKILYSWRMEM